MRTFKRLSRTDFIKSTALLTTYQQTQHADSVNINKCSIREFLAIIVNIRSSSAIRAVVESSPRVKQTSDSKGQYYTNADGCKYIFLKDNPSPSFTRCVPASRFHQPTQIPYMLYSHSILSAPKAYNCSIFVTIGKREKKE